MCISFLGTLPLGTVNLTATVITVKSGVKDGLLFSSGCIFIETLCLCFVLIAMDWVSKKKKVFRMFEWMTVLLILVMAIGSFVAAFKMEAFGNNIFTSYQLSPFVLGLLLSSLNPLHIPFWIGWTTVLIKKKIITGGKKNYFMYVTGITIGTFTGFIVFIFGGNYFIQQAGSNQQLINWVVGVVLLIITFIQLYKMIYKRVPVKSLYREKNTSHQHHFRASDVNCM
jgi:threonine/homoserine/homoserine lactone efflux protein